MTKGVKAEIDDDQKEGSAGCERPGDICCVRVCVGKTIQNLLKQHKIG